MKEYIAEYIVPVEKKGNDNMFDFMNAKPLIRCKDCRYFSTGQNECETWSECLAHISRSFETCEDNFCSWAERRGEEDV